MGKKHASQYANFGSLQAFRFKLLKGVEGGSINQYGI